MWTQKGNPFIYCYRYCNVIKLIYKLINKDEEKKQRHPIL